jgi:hypothetical protein
VGTGGIDSICSALTAEPLFHLSLHSKELFHSNLLGWLCETCLVASVEVFARWVPARVGSTNLCVQRERSHLDLAVELPGLAPFVVENKVFAPPDDAQLDEYAAGPLAGLTDPTLLLLSLGRPIWDADEYLSSSGHVWRHLSYRQLADALDDARGGIAGFDGALVAHYCSFIRSLHALADVAGDVGPDDPIALDDATREVLRDIRLHDAIGKLRARVTIAAARARTTPLLPGAQIRWEALFTNSTPLVAAFLDRRDGDWLGWQYQGSQWRVVVITSKHKGTDPDTRARRHAYVAERYADWFDFTAITTLTGRPIGAVPPTEARGEYNGYNPDFAYRYRSCPTSPVPSSSACRTTT